MNHHDIHPVGAYGNVQRILMTIDAVGGVWRYAMDLAVGLKKSGIEVVFVGFGPRPTMTQRREAEALGVVVWSNLPLDWMVDDPALLDPVAEFITTTANLHKVNLLHLNLPSQANGLQTDLPVLVVSHSCVVTWFAAVEHRGIPRIWDWQARINQQGFARADLTIVPSQSHASALETCYGPLHDLHIVYNASRAVLRTVAPEPFMLAVGRWWDKGKNGQLLNAAAPKLKWPLIMVGSNQSPRGDTLAIEHAKHLGELPHAQTLALIERAGIFVSPSLYEPFGLAVLEAAHTRTALALADIPIYRELWDDAALFFDPTDPASLADCVNRLSRRAELRADLAAAAWRRAQILTPDLQLDQMLGHYRNMFHRTAHYPAAI